MVRPTQAEQETPVSQRYAARTDVPVERSRMEIERMLTRYGADQFVSGWDQRASMIGFRIGGRVVRLEIPMPDRANRDITHSQTGTRRSPTQAQKAYDQATRQRWRALKLVLTAKLEAVAAGITTIEQEFLANLILPTGQTIGEWAGPQLEAIYERGALPALLPGAEP